MKLSIKKIIIGVVIGLSKLIMYYLTVLNLINFYELPFFKKVISIFFLISIIFYEILITQNSKQIHTNILKDN